MFAVTFENPYSILINSINASSLFCFSFGLYYIWKHCFCLFVWFVLSTNPIDFYLHHLTQSCNVLNDTSIFFILTPTTQLVWFAMELNLFCSFCKYRPTNILDIIVITQSESILSRKNLKHRTWMNGFGSFNITNHEMGIRREGKWKKKVLDNRSYNSPASSKIIFYLSSFNVSKFHCIPYSPWRPIKTIFFIWKSKLKCHYSIKQNIVY